VYYTKLVQGDENVPSSKLNIMQILFLHKRLSSRLNLESIKNILMVCSMEIKSIGMNLFLLYHSVSIDLKNNRRIKNVFIHISFVFAIISIKIYFNKRNKNEILRLTFFSEIIPMPLLIITSLMLSIKQRIKSIVNTFTYERKQKLFWNTEILIWSFVL
jgi:hypothetical protein